METNGQRTCYRLVKLSVAVVLAMILILSVAYLPAKSCTIAVVSAQASADGRPILWKNYDMSAYWRQQVKYFSGNGAGGDYYLLYHDNNSLWAGKSAITPQGSMNKAGLSIVVSAVADANILNASFNANTRFLHDATVSCTSMADFENYLSTWHRANPLKAVSANYAIIDAQGGAAIYEVYMAHQLIPGISLKFKKFDANSGQISDEQGNLIQPQQDIAAGYYVRSNYNSYFPRAGGLERAHRAEALLAQLAAPGTANKLTPPAIMHFVSKDVTGKQPASSTTAKYSTTYCISRSQTRSGLVVEGVAAGDDPRLTTFWAALGEPSLSVFVPTFVGSGTVSPYLYEDHLGSDIDKSDINVLNLLADERETYKKLIYSSNRGSAFLGPLDPTINKNELAKVQAWTFEIEREAVEHTLEFLTQARQTPELQDPAVLSSFQDHCAWYVYENYAAGSADKVSWDQR